MRKKGYVCALVGVGLVLLGMACAKRAEVSSPPSWIGKGSYQVPGEAFYGVGILSGVQNPGLAREAVDNRARVTLARILDTYIKGLMKDYSSSVIAGNVGAKQEDQLITNVTKTVTEQTLSGSFVEEHYFDMATNTYYALAKLPFENVVSNLKRSVASALNGVKIDAEKAMIELDKEIEKRRETDAKQQ